MKRGEAFWIHCKGSSDFTGPLDVSLEQGETVDYADSLVEQTVRIGNRSAADYGAVTVTVTGNVPLNYWEYAPEANEAGWTPLPVDLPIPAGGQNSLRLAVDRDEFRANRYPQRHYRNQEQRGHADSLAGECPGNEQDRFMGGPRRY